MFSRTHASVVFAGNCCRQRVTVDAGDRIRFKWVSRGGDVKFGLSFYPQASDAQRKHQGSIETNMKDEVPVPGTGPKQSLVALGKIPGSDTHYVFSEVVAPSTGTLVATWDNLAGWHQRTVLHRWDVMLDGHPAILSADDTGEGSNDIGTRSAKESTATDATEGHGSASGSSATSTSE